MTRSRRCMFRLVLLFAACCFVFPSSGILADERGSTAGGSKGVSGAIDSSGIEKKFEFLDTYRTPKVFALPPPFGPIMKPWRPEEKQVVLAQLRHIATIVPGLVERATADQPIRLYRREREGSKVALYGPIDHSICLLDLLFTPPADQKSSTRLRETLVHELTHAVDSGFQLSWGKEWVALVKPRLDRARQAILRETGVAGMFPSEPKYLSASLCVVVSEELPSDYGAISLPEALAEYTRRMVTEKGYAPPQGIESFIQANVLATPSSGRSPTWQLRQVFVEVEGDRRAEALEILNGIIREVPESRPFCYIIRGRLRLVQGPEYRQQALDDWHRAIDLAPEASKAAIFDWAWYTAINAKTKEPYKAVSEIDRYLQQDPKDSHFLTFRAMVWMASGIHHEALPDCERALASDPKDGTSKMNRMFAIQGMLRDLKNKDASVRLIAARGLGAAVPTTSAELKALTTALQGVLQDDDKRVRKAALESIERLQKAAVGR